MIFTRCTIAPSQKQQLGTGVIEDALDVYVVIAWHSVARSLLEDGYDRDRWTGCGADTREARAYPA